VSQVTERTQGNEIYDADAQKRSMMNEKAYRLQMQSIEVLKDKLGVEDNRFRFF
jgi:peptidyl-prolyl cis-trans isomerase D